MSCDLCGKEEELFRVKIEGSVIQVCKNCSKYGEVLVSLDRGNVEPKIKISKKFFESEEKIEVVVKDFSKILRREREKRGLNQEELAKKVNEKLSVIHKLENGHMEPSLELAKKLGKFFGVKLVKEENSKMEKEEEEDKIERRNLTLGDLFEK